MKKSLFKTACVCTATMALLFASCTQLNDAANDAVASPEHIYYPGSYEARKLPAPEMNVYSLPLQNVVTWKPVVGASKYNVYKYTEANGTKFLATISTGDTKNNYVYKDNLTIVNCNGEEIIYYVEAMPAYATSPDTDVAHPLYVEHNMSSIKANSKIPAYGKNVLDFGKLENLTVKADDVDYNNLRFSFNGSTYLDYAAYLVKGNLEASLLSDASVDTLYNYLENKETKLSLSTVNASYDKGDATYVGSAIVTTSGDYYIYVIAKENTSNVNGYKKSFKNTVAAMKFEAFEVSKATGTPVVSYLDAGHTARLVWTPAESKSTNVYATTATASNHETVIIPTDYYTVWKQNNDTKMTEKVTAEIKNENGKYVIDDEIVDNTVSYTYYVVLSSNTPTGKYVESATGKNVVLSAYGRNTIYYKTPAAIVTMKDVSRKSVDVCVEIKENQKIVSVKYANIPANYRNDESADVGTIVYSEYGTNEVEKNASELQSDGYKYYCYNITRNDDCYLSVIVETSQADEVDPYTNEVLVKYENNFTSAVSGENRVSPSKYNVSISAKNRDNRVVSLDFRQDTSSKITYKYSYASAVTYDTTFYVSSKFSTPTELDDLKFSYDSYSSTYSYSANKSITLSNTGYIVLRVDIEYPEGEKEYRYIPVLVTN